MRNELKRHKKSDRVKWCIAFAAIVLLAAGLTLICLQLFTPYKPSNGFREVESDSVVRASENLDCVLSARNSLPAELAEHSGVQSADDYTAEYRSFVTIVNNKNIATDVGFYVSGAMPMGKVIWVPKISPIPGHDVESIICAAASYVKEHDLLTQTNYVTTNYVGVRFSQLSSSVTANITYNLTPKPSKPLPPTPSKEGHTFVGWYYDEALTRPYDGAPIYEDVTFYAKFEINRYTVAFDSNGGSYCESVTVDWNTSPTLPTPTRTGYTFVGWFDGETQYTDAPVKANKNLVAHWEIMTFTVTFMVDGAVYKQITVDYGTGLSDAADIAELTYYTFYDASGVLEGRSAVITENTTLSAAEMSKAEKVGFFLARNNWIPIAGAASIGVLLLTTIIMGIVIKKRG